MEKLKEIVRSNQMSSRPEFYSGRGAILCDLNGKMLEGIYQGILKEYGLKAAKNYVKMVADIKVLSATTFLEELYMLFGSNWIYRKKKNQAPGISIPKNEDGEYDEKSMFSGMIGIFSAMTNNLNETPMIKNAFLLEHGIKLKGKDISVWYDDFDTIYYK